MEDSEKYLSGFYSSMQLALNKWATGAGIYATDMRLVLTGVGADLDFRFRKMVTGSGRKDFDPSRLTPEQNQAIIKALSIESAKQLVIRKDQISTLEIKLPPGIFRTGYLRIHLNLWRNASTNHWQEERVPNRFVSSTIVQSPSLEASH